MPLSDEQQRIRMQGTGGSELGAVAGLNPHMSPLQVCLTKWGEAPPFEGNDDTDRGEFFEDGTAKWWAKKTGATDLTEPGTILSPSHKYLLSTPDRKAKLKCYPVVAQVKVPRRFAKGWGEPGSDRVPPSVLAQIHDDMHVAGTDLGHVVRFADDELHIYPVRFDPEFWGLLVEANNRLWVDHILKRVPPPAGYQDTETLKYLLPSSRAPKLQLADLPPETTQLVDTFRAVRAQFKAAEELHDALINRLKQVMGTAEGLETPWGRIDWKQNKSGKQVDWQASFIAMQQAVNLFCSNKPELLPLRETLQEIEASNTKDKPGARPFVVRFKEAA